MLLREWLGGEKVLAREASNLAISFVNIPLADGNIEHLLGVLVDGSCILIGIEVVGCI